MFTQFSSEDESLGRYIALVSSVGSWFKNIEWVKYGDYSSYLTLPGKGLPLYFNGTSATLHAVLGNIAAVGLSKWDLGFPRINQRFPYSKQDQWKMSYFGKDNARSAHLYEVYQGKSVLIILLHRDAGTSRYSFIWASPLAWLNSLSLVNNDGYYLTTAQKTKDNVFFNGTNVYPISFALAGAGMIAYAGEQPEKDVHFYTFALLQHNRKKHTFVNCTPPLDIQAVWIAS